jgi:hypothetical protein
MYRFQIPIFVYSRVHPYSFRPISNATKAKQGDMKHSSNSSILSHLSGLLVLYFYSPLAITRSLARCHSRDLLLPKVLQLVCSVDSILTLLPTSWTNFSMLIGELESFNNPKTLFDRPSNREIVNMGCPEDTLWVDEERSSEGDTFFF